MSTNRLYRDQDEAMLGGVCAGIAKRFDTDPTLVRVVVIAAAVLTLGTTVLLYLAAWIIMPAGPDAPMARPSRDQLTGEIRDASGRVTEAGRILGRAAKQAADEISALRRPVAEPPVGEDAAGAQAVNEAVNSEDGPPVTGGAPPTPPTPPTYPETQYSETQYPETQYPSSDAPPPPPPTPGSPGEERPQP